MAQGGEHIELKFRIYDGTDIAHSTYAPSTTVATLKQRLVAEWPQDEDVCSPGKSCQLAEVYQLKPTSFRPSLLACMWVGDKSVVPKSVSDIKLIHAGKVLENGKTLAESRVHFGDLPGGVSTMHVVVQPPVPKKKTGCRLRVRDLNKNQEKNHKQNSCSCAIL
ncbi:unnamed protein product [Camellia sinensis]